MTTSSTIWFFVNGKEVFVDAPDPELTLAYYIRNCLGLTGTKLGCEEGVCGACTIVLGKYDSRQKKPVYRAVNSCLVPLYMVDRCSVITIEGVSMERIHPIQERMSVGHATQCGFCSPGFILAMYALLRNHPEPTMEQINQAVKGNLCRCTGYRPILEALYSFSCEQKVQGCCGGGKSGGCPCKEEKVEPMEKKLTSFQDMRPYDPTQDLIFPPQLLIDCEQHADSTSSLRLEGPRIKLFAPRTFVELQRELIKFANLQNPEPCPQTVSSGMITRLRTVKNPSPGLCQEWFSIHRIPELSHFIVEEDRLLIGSAATIGDVQDILREYTAYSEPIIELLKKYSSDQVKHFASFVGSLVASKKTSDICSIALSLNLHLVVKELADLSETEITVEELLNRPAPRLPCSQIITQLILPRSMPGVQIFTFKQCARRGADTTVVNMVACLSTEMEEPELTRVVFGLEGNHIITRRLSQWIHGRSFTAQNNNNYKELWREACALLNADVNDVKGIETSDYELSLCRAALFEVLNQLSGEKLYERIPLDPQTFESVQLFKKTDGPLGRPLAHQWAERHTTGSAKYINDIDVKGLLHFGPVLSTEEHAEILSIDASEALQVKGVVAYLDVKDIPSNGTNTPGLCSWSVWDDDAQVFADGKVTCIGQIVCGIVAEDVVTARQAAKLVKINYRKLPAITSIEEAIEQKSYLYEPQIFGVSMDEVQNKLKQCDQIMEGEIEIGGQEHFYMETQSTTIVPGEEDEYTVYTATQNAGHAQPMCAAVVGISSNKVVVKVKRLGGGFGGKADQCGRARFPCMVAAHKLKKPVSCIFSRTCDMLATGKRHPVLFRYKIGFSNVGRLEALHIQSYANGGNTRDNTFWIVRSIGGLSTGPYFVPTARAEAFSLKTNTQSNTAFRGFGQPQCNFAIEKIMCQIATAVGKNLDEVKELNFAHVGKKNLLDEHIRNDGLLECWEECKRLSQFEKLRTDVDHFNSKSKFVKRGVTMMTARCPLPHFGWMEQAAALVQICMDGGVLLSIGGAEMGQGINIKMIQIASHVLKIPMDRITILDLSTETTVNSPITGGSQGTDLHGRAVKAACEKLMAGLEPYIQRCNGDWDKAVFQAWHDKAQLQATEQITLERAKYGIGEEECLYFTAGAACIQAEVDCLTGEHKLVSVDIAMDVGKSINPAIDIGQIEGAFTQGYGLMTCEELTYEGGKLLTNSAHEYKIPTVQMAPEKFRVKLIDGVSNHAEQIYSSKGIGEPPLMLGIGVHTAIVEAICAYRKGMDLPEIQMVNAPLTAKSIQKLANQGLDPQDLAK